MSDDDIDAAEDFFFGLIPRKSIVEVLFLTIVCFSIVLIQAILFLFLWIKHPRSYILNSEGVVEQDLEFTTRNYKQLVDISLAKAPAKHYHAIKKWLVVQDLNINNYAKSHTPDSGTGLVVLEVTDEEAEDGRKVQKTKLQLNQMRALLSCGDYIDAAAASQIKNTTETPMMAVINHHITIINWISKLKHFNFRMETSEATELRKSRLTWRRVIETLRTIDEAPRIPKSLHYSVVREIKDQKNWTYETDGLKLKPELLAEKPWPGLENEITIYMKSFFSDILIHWFQIWFSLVVVKFVFV